ncbi:MAG: 4-(cytidine 5'-diphospho)-2-C-methyl-D-erythritol kinase [Longimicrobiales bacterium]
MARYAAHAKINLHLAVLARETTGYHQIETLFHALDLADDVEVNAEGAGVQLEVSGADVGPTERNTAYLAACTFFEQARTTPAARIRITKNVPVGAGLGGGSSDAAVTLRALNELYGSPLDELSLREIGFSIGSDVPFFLAAHPFALAWGRGERLLALPPLPAAPTLLVVPTVPMSTREAYHALATRRAARADRFSPQVLRADDLTSYQRIAALAHNDFEEIVFAALPELRAIKQSLAAAGAIHTLVTGSGSALFAIFEDEAARESAAARTRLEFQSNDIITTATCTHL